MNSSQKNSGSQDPPATGHSKWVRTPVVAVITPTWRRHELLLNRCMPSVAAQDYLRVRHVIVSDGPDENLRDYFRQHGDYHVLYREVHKHDPAPHWGSAARQVGVRSVLADYFTYVDDDDMLRPDHCSKMVAALREDPEAGFAVSRMLCHSPAGDTEVGWGSLGPGNVGTPMIMHRLETLEYGTWGPPSEFEDWEIVERWLNAGVKCANVSATTSETWPHKFRPWEGL